MEIIIRCTTCEYVNSMNRGMPYYVERQTEFNNSFTDAFNHIKNNADYEDHEMILELRDDKFK